MHVSTLYRTWHDVYFTLTLTPQSMFTVQSLFLETWVSQQCELISLYQFQSNCIITITRVWAASGGRSRFEWWTGKNRRNRKIRIRIKEKPEKSWNLCTGHVTDRQTVDYDIDFDHIYLFIIGHDLCTYLFIFLHFGHDLFTFVYNLAIFCL